MSTTPSLVSHHRCFRSIIRAEIDNRPLFPCLSQAAISIYWSSIYPSLHRMHQTIISCIIRTSSIYKIIESEEREAHRETVTIVLFIARELINREMGQAHIHTRTRKCGRIIDQGRPRSQNTSVNRSDRDASS